MDKSQVFMSRCIDSVIVQPPRNTWAPLPPLLFFSVGLVIRTLLMDYDKSIERKE